MKQITVKFEKLNDLDSIIDGLVVEDKGRGAVFETISPSIDGGSTIFISIFDRPAQ